MVYGSAKQHNYHQEKYRTKRMKKHLIANTFNPPHGVDHHASGS